MNDPLFHVVIYHANKNLKSLLLLFEKYILQRSKRMQEKITKLLNVRLKYWNMIINSHFYLLNASIEIITKNLTWYWNTNIAGFKLNARTNRQNPHYLFFLLLLLLKLSKYICEPLFYSTSFSYKEISQ